MDTRRIAESNAHIPTEEILKDIADTEAEIVQMEREAEHYSKTPIGAPTTRLDHMRAAARKSGIEERKEFIKKLRSILKYREKGDNIDTESGRRFDSKRDNNATQ